MIHYTLLPEKDIKSLKREYRFRLVIFLLFFISCTMLAGIASLIPAYLLSYSQEKDAIKELTVLQKSTKDPQNESIKKELAQSGEIIKKLNDNNQAINFSDVIYKIVSHRNNQVKIDSMNLSYESISSSTDIAINLQGKANTRDSLVQFKTSLESDPLISSVELPISDLAKNKDISFTLKVSLKKKKQ